MTAGLGQLAVRLAYRSGLLAAYHRLANRHHLTVAGFHRVLAQSDPRWARANPHYTCSDELFEACVRFFKAHYTVLDPKLLAGDDPGPLPPRPLVISFDDGWADNVDYALPILERHGVPAVFFVVADAIGRADAFWQEILYGDWRTGLLDAKRFAAIAEEAGYPERPADPVTEDDAYRLTMAILALERPARTALVARHLPAPAGGARPPEMLSPEQLARLAAAGMTIAVHGATHEPLTDAGAVPGELLRARDQLSALLAGSARNGLSVLSFPHGRYDGRVVAAARQAGFRRMFTSDACLNAPQPEGRFGDLLGRIVIESSTIVDATGHLRPERLGVWLFHRPVRRVAA